MDFKSLIITIESIVLFILATVSTCRFANIDNRATLRVSQCLADKRFEEWAKENYMFVEKVTMWESGEVQLILHNTLNKKGD